MAFKVMIVGPEDVGKTSLSKLLLSYALRHGRQPMFINLDSNEVSRLHPISMDYSMLLLI